MRWPIKKLGEMAILNPSKSEIKDLPNDVEISFVPMSAVDENKQKIRERDTRTLGSVRKGYTYFKEGDILFAKITPCMENGKVAIAKDLANGIGFGSTEFHVIRPGRLVISEWIFYFISRPDFRKEAKKHMTGTAGQQRVPVEFLESIEIPLPPFSEQKRIVKKIEKFFAEIDKAEKLRKETIEDTENLLKSAMQEVFERGGKEGWITKKLGEIASLRMGETLIKRDLTGDGLPVYSADSTEIPWGFTSRNKLKFPRGSLVIGARGTIGSVKLPKDKFFTATQTTIIITPKKLIVPKFLYFVLYLHDFRKITTGVGIPMITIRSLKNLQIPLPPFSEQKQIVAYLDSLSKKIRQLKELQNQTAHEISQLRQSILDKAFKGQL